MGGVISATQSRNVTSCLGYPTLETMLLATSMSAACGAATMSGPALMAYFPGPGTVNVTVCPVKTWCSGLTNSISTLCWPGGSPTKSIVLLSLVSAQCRYVQMPDPWRYVEGARSDHQ
jgi:hypothetical protein